MRASPIRHGWTRVDLIAVLAVLTVVAAVLVPTLQKARAEADWVKCAANLRDLGVAAHRYHEDHGRLPPGYWGPLDPQTKKTDWPLDFKAQNVGMLPALLPYLGQEEFFKHLQFGKGEAYTAYLDLDQITAPWWTNDRLFHLAKAKVPAFLCPANPNTEPTGGFMLAMHLYEPTTEVAFYPTKTVGVLGRTHYLGTMGTGPSRHPFLNSCIGVFGNRSRVSLKTVAQDDGTSYTLMFGESLGSSLDPQLEYANAWMGCGAMSTYFGIGRMPRAGENKDRFDPLEWYRFGGLHERVANFCFADGSVRGVRPGITAVWLSPDWYVFMQLTGRNDGRDDDVSTLID
jgi:prepilin-type processing-associated H-X9-DG protein